MTNTKQVPTEYWTKHHDKYGRSAQALYVDGVTQAVAVRLPGGFPEGRPILVNMWLLPQYVDGLKFSSENKVTYHSTMQAAKKWAWETTRAMRLTPDKLEDASLDQLGAAWTLSHWQLSRAQGMLSTLDRLKVEEISVSRVGPTATVDQWSRRVDRLRELLVAQLTVAA